VGPFGICQQVRQRLSHSHSVLLAAIKAFGGLLHLSFYINPSCCRLDGENKKDIDRSTFTLADMVQWGLKHPSEATQALLDFIAELRMVSGLCVAVTVVLLY
jgi:hypothetical protein